MSPGSGPESAQNPRSPQENCSPDPPPGTPDGGRAKNKIKNVLRHNWVLKSPWALDRLAEAFRATEEGHRNWPQELMESWIALIPKMEGGLGPLDSRPIVLLPILLGPIQRDPEAFLLALLKTFTAS